MIQNLQKGIILITGVPGSGKSFLSKILKEQIVSKNISVKILQIDRLQAMISKIQQSKISQNYLINLFKQSDWYQQIQKYQLDKRIFNQKTWKSARQYSQNEIFLDLFIQNSEILIIQDQLPLKSLRKPYRKYCFLRKIKFLQIQISIKIQKALQQNLKRGQVQQSFKVPQQIIKKSYQKFQHNQFALVIEASSIKKFIQSKNIINLLTPVNINDNYSQYLEKKNKKHQMTQNQLDQNSLRKLISQIMKEEQVSKQYFGQFYKLSNKIKAQILATCKKVYIEKKRIVSFKNILQDCLKKNQQNYSKMI